MAQKLLISPFSNGSAKNYPYWDKVCEALKDDFELIQLGLKGEAILPLCTQKFDLPLKEVEALIKEVRKLVCIDNFAQHCAWYFDIPCIVVFGPSDPQLFGHKENTNLLKSRDMFRKDIFGYWKGYVWEHKDDGWISPEEVVETIRRVYGCERVEVAGV